MNFFVAQFLELALNLMTLGFMVCFCCFDRLAELEHYCLQCHCILFSFVEDNLTILICNFCGECRFCRNHSPNIVQIANFRTPCFNGAFL